MTQSNPMLLSKINSFTPLRGKVFITNLEEGARITRGGIILRDDNMKDHGIRPRWGQVWSIGPDITNIKKGDWVLIEHGRWTLRIPLDIDDDGRVDIWMIEPEAILLVSDYLPEETMCNKGNN